MAITLPPSDDTDVNLKQGKQNYGARPDILVRKLGASGERRGFVKFNLAILPAGAKIEKAVLRVFVSQVHKPGDISLHVVTGDWEESTLTARTLPGITSAIGSAPIHRSDQKKYIEFHIPSIVQDWVDGTMTNHGIAILPVTGGINVSLDSKENLGTSHSMELEVVLEGSSGSIGPQGPIGPAGADGAIGPQGPTGPAGTDGAAGLQGPAGPAGTDGAIGPQGPTGPAGADGAAGLQGPVGPAGADGAVGPQGPTGPAGTDGAVGPQGPVGPAGTDGAVGPQGPAGPAGPAGADGATGLQGPVGPDGADGAAGLQGPVGPEGEDGAVGPQGPAGPAGEVGAVGPQGPAGPAGSDGVAGPQGTQGEAGPQGPMGLPGTTNTRMALLSRVINTSDGPQAPSFPARQWNKIPLNDLRQYPSDFDGSPSSFVTINETGEFELQPGIYFVGYRTVAFTSSNTYFAIHRILDQTSEIAIMGTQLTPVSIEGSSTTGYSMGFIEVNESSQTFFLGVWSWHAGSFGENFNPSTVPPGVEFERPSEVWISKLD